MNVRHAVLAGWILCLAGFSACSKDGGAAKPGAVTDNAGRPPVAVEVLRLSGAEVTEGVDVVGTLAARYDAEVKSEFGGRVTDVFVTEWVRVRKGQPLARVDTREGDVTLQRSQAAVELAGANVLEAEAAARRAEREHQRSLRLKEVGLITQQSLDDAASQREAAAARVEAMKAALKASEEDVRQARTRLSKAYVRAPFDGTVAERHVSVGEVVGEMQKVVFRIVDNRLLDLTVTVPSGSMAALRVGQPLSFATDAVPGRTFEGKVKHINPVVNEADRSVKVVAEVRNVPEVLRSGLFVKGRIVTGSRPDVVQVPRSALLGWDMAARRGDLYVAENGAARRRAVRTGAVSGDRVEVVEGVAAGDNVVVRGGFNLKDGDRISVGRVIGGRG